MPRRQATVVLVGRPNVGKSTLFNRMSGSRRAIVAPVAGTTRDSLARPVAWGAATHELVVRHGQRAIVGADLIVMIVDGREGLVPGDETIARELREAGRPVILAINKTDDKRARDAAMDFYQLGFDPVVEISAEHGQGVGDLLDEIVKRIGDGSPARASARHDPATETAPRDEPAAASAAPSEVRVAIVGR